MKNSKNLIITIFILLGFITAYSQDSRIFWVDQSLGKIQSATPQGLWLADVISGLQQPECVAIDTTSSPKKIYCTEAGASRIIRLNFDGSGLEEIVTGIDGLEDLALDLVNRKVYWLTDLYSQDKVQRADMDSLNSNIETVYTNSYAMHGFHGIGVHPDHQWVFWTQYVYGGLDRVNRINYDGTGRTTLGNYLSPRDIEVVGEKIYWIWGGSDLMMQANLDGSEADTFLTNVNGHFFAMDTALGQVFWTESNKIKCANLDNSGHVDLLTGLSNSLRGIALYYNPLSSITRPENEIINGFYLAQNYPNPFNPVTHIRFELYKTSEVTLTIHNILGQKVAALLSASLIPGSYQFEWNAGSNPSGFYFYELQTGNFQQVKRMLLIK